MDEIHSTLGAVLRRMKYNLWARSCSKATLFLLSLLSLFLIVDSLFYLGPWVRRDLFSLSIALGLIAISSCAYGIFVAYTRGPDKLDAAIEVDERMGLKARLASAVELTDPDHPMERAVVIDAAYWAERVDVKRSFPIETPRSTYWSLIPLTLAVLIALGLPPIDLLGRQVAAQEEEVELKQKEKEEVRKVLKTYNKQVKEFRTRSQKKKQPRSLMDITKDVERVTSTDDKDRDARAAIKKISQQSP